MTPTKFKALLDAHPTLPVHVDASRVSGMPEHLTGRVCLHLGWRLVPETFLQVNVDGVDCVLSFDRKPHPLHIPWDALLWVHGADVPQPKPAARQTQVGGNVVQVDFRARKRVTV